MKRIRTSVAGVALLALAACTGNGTGNGSAEGTGGKAATPGGGIDRAARDGAKVTFDAAGVSDTVYFDYDKTTLKPDALPTLRRIAEWMRQHPSVQIRIAGHADERGTREYNLALGDRRATTVRAYLVSLGIPSDRLRTVSYGKEFPFDPGHDESAYSKNRRAHFVITAK